MSVVVVANLNAAQLEALLARYEKDVAASYRKAIAAIRDGLTLEQLARIIETGDTSQLDDLIIRSVDRFADEVSVLYVEAAALSAALLSGQLGLVISFSSGNPLAQDFIRQYKLDLIQQVTRPQIEAARAVVTRSLVQGVNPTVAARDLRSQIGLTTHQQAQVDRYRQLLIEGSKDFQNFTLRDRRSDSRILRMFREGKQLTQPEIDRLVQRYLERRIASRAKTIARTESLRSLNQGLNDGVQNAVNNGDIRANDVVREWVTASDERVRGSHRSMNGQLRAFGEPFLSGNGYELAYPGDASAPGSETINCRCVVTTTLRENGNA